MPYYNENEYQNRLKKIKKLIDMHQVDCLIIYYDEFNLANAWYLTAWCPQFESGAVLVPAKGKPLILGGPESEPFAKMDSAIKDTRNLPVFMVPEEEYPNAEIIGFEELFDEINRDQQMRRIGIVGMDQMPYSVWTQIKANLGTAEVVDMTAEYTELRQNKSRWEREQIRQVFQLADYGYDAMINSVKPGIPEYEIAAAGEFAVRKAGANGFGFKAIVGSGKRSNAVVPTAGNKVLESGELVMVGLSPRWNGYSGVFGDTVIVGDNLSPIQKDMIGYLKEAFYLTKEALKPGKIGKEIDAPARKLFEEKDLQQYLICPFAHTIGLNEAEAPFFGPKSTDELTAGMTVCVDVSLFGHPEVNGMRIETGYEITDRGPEPLSVKMDKLILS